MINIFKLEEYLTHYEFTAPHLLCCSDAESFSMQEILKMASPDDKALWDTLRLGYTEVKGMPALRQQIAESLYPTLAPDDISCFAGAEEALFCALHTLCEPGDHVIVLTPCYQSFLEIPRLKGADVTEVMLREENEWCIDPESIAKAIRHNTQGIVINFPHNPTGQVITPQELKILITICEAHNLWLVSDEVYRLLGAPQEGWAPPAAELYSKALSIGVMSKAFGMAGLRVGWIACQDRQLLQKIEYMRHYTSICNSAPSELLSLMALKNKDRILERNNQIVANNLQLLDVFMEEYHHLFEWIRPQGGCIGFVKYKDPEPIERFTERLVKEKGVLLMPALIYDYPANYFRIGFGRNNMPIALDKLKEFLQS